VNALPKIPVTVLTGFLGSGKTTLLNRVLRSPQWSDTAIVVNEFGEIALDQLLIESASDNIRVLASGCLCCTLQGGLRETLAGLFVRRVNGKVPRFARVIVETTGLADPGPVANSLVADALLRAEYRFSAIATTVDAMHGVAQIERFPEAARQAALADVLIVTKTDLASREQTAELCDRLRDLNPVAPVIQSARGDVDPRCLFPDNPPLDIQHADAAAAHTHMQAWSFVIERPVHWSGLAAWMAYAEEHFGERLLRVKGIFTIAEEDSAVAIHGVGRFFHPPERLGRRGDGVSRLVCIGRDIGQRELEASVRLFEMEEATRGI
jgi:G3E family GTPase